MGYAASPSKWLAILGLACLPAAIAAAQQQDEPRIGYVYPAGGKQGTTFEVIVGGQFLGRVNSAFLSGSGVKVEMDEHVKDIYTKPTTPAIAETVRLKVTLAPDAQPGERELRLLTANGLTNPRVFCIGQLTEFSETPSNLAVDPKKARDLKNANQPRTARPGPEMDITLPATVNGQIMPGGACRYRFQATKGMKLVAAGSARELIPYLPDAVPGWFQAAITLYDANDNELCYADHYRFHPDPAFCYDIPCDGQYVLEIRDSIFRGREDFVYRIAIGELPFITDVFPLGCKTGTETIVEAKGWNLPSATLAFDATGKSPGIYSLFAGTTGCIFNRVPFAVDALPDCLKKTPNNSTANAQAVTPPIIINGRIDQPGQWDFFRFEGRESDEIVAEVYARRLGSPLDSVLQLTDSRGQELAFNDDHEDKGSGLNTHHADSYIRFKLPTSGAYFVRVGDAQHQGGPEYAYRLRISPPQPDFELRVAPSSISVHGGTNFLLGVYALRKDGFAGEISLSVKGGPAGLLLGGGLVPTNQDQVRVTLTPPSAPIKGLADLSIEGQATIQGRKIVHTAVPAEDMMQAFAYRHLVPSKELELTTAGKSQAKDVAKILGATPVKIPAGGTACVQVGLPSKTQLGKIQFELDSPPDGIAIQKSSPIPEGMEIVLQDDPSKAKAGLKGNLIVNIYEVPAPPASAPATPLANQKRKFMGTLPAIPFEVVAAASGGG